MFKYELLSYRGIKILGTTKKVEKLVIPEEIDGYKVVKIENHAFAHSSIKEVTFPESLVEIGHYAFEGCNLENLTLPESIREIGRSAFYKNKLKSVVLPSDLSTISAGTFSRNKINSVTISDGISSIDRGAFSHNCINKVSVPKSVWLIEEDAFLNNNVQSVSLTKGVKRLGDKAFELDTLKNVSLDNVDGLIQSQIFGEHTSTIQKVYLEKYEEARNNVKGFSRKVAHSNMMEFLSGYGIALYTNDERVLEEEKSPKNEIISVESEEEFWECVEFANKF